MTTATKVSLSLEETAPIQSLLSTVVEKTSNFLNSDQDEEVKKLLTTHTHISLRNAGHLKHFS